MKPSFEPNKNELATDSKKKIKSGFFWIGSASVLSQALTALAMIIAMLFLSANEMGMATIVLAISVCLESFAGLGMGQAVLQDNNLKNEEIHSAFWFATGFGILVFLLCVPLAWPVSAFYGEPALIPLLIAGVAKFPLSSIATVPMQLVNRRLEYQKLSAINVFSTLGCSIIKITLAACGCGAWALVIGDTAYGLGMLIGGFAFSKYCPALHFKWTECRRFANYGLKTCIGNLIDQLNKNLHYLLIGKFLGGSTLGIYRITYELAMTPALAVFSVITKSSFPVFARLQDNRPELSKLFFWNQKNISLFVAITSIFIWIASADIFGLMEDANADWMASVKLIPFVLMIAFTKSMLQAYPDLYRACGKPGYSIYSSLTETGLILILCTLSLILIPETYALKGMLFVWEAILLIVFAMHSRIVKRFIDSTLKIVWQNLKDALLFMLFSGAICFVILQGLNLFDLPNTIRLVLEVVSLIACLAIFSKYRLKLSLRELWQNKNKKSQETITKA